MQFMSEAESARLVSHEMAFDAAREAMIAVVDDAVIFPAVIAHGSVPSNRFSVKSASTSAFAGLKVGSFWPGNGDIGLPRHNSLILLFDQEVGRVDWVIEAGAVNAYRTAVRFSFSKKFCIIKGSLFFFNTTFVITFINIVFDILFFSVWIC